MFRLFFLPFLHYHITQHHIQDILPNHLIHAHGLNRASFLIYLLLPFFLLAHPSRAVHLLLLYVCHHIHQILFALLHDIHFLYLQSLLRSINRFLSNVYISVRLILHLLSSVSFIKSPYSRSASVISICQALFLTACPSK